MLWMVNAQLSFLERGKPSERSNCWVTVEGRDLLCPLRLLLIRVLITKALVSLPLPFPGIDGKQFFFFKLWGWSNTVTDCPEM